MRCCCQLQCPSHKSVALFRGHSITFLHQSLRLGRNCGNHRFTLFRCDSDSTEHNVFVDDSIRTLRISASISSLRFLCMLHSRRKWFTSTVSSNLHFHSSFILLCTSSVDLEKSNLHVPSLSRARILLSCLARKRPHGVSINDRTRFFGKQFVTIVTTN